MNPNNSRGLEVLPDVFHSFKNFLIAFGTQMGADGPTLKAQLSQASFLGDLAPALKTLAGAPKFKPHFTLPDGKVVPYLKVIIMPLSATEDGVANALFVDVGFNDLQHLGRAKLVFRYAVNENGWGLSGYGFNFSQDMGVYNAQGLYRFLNIISAFEDPLLSQSIIDVLGAAIMAINSPSGSVARHDILHILEEQIMSVNQAPLSGRLCGRAFEALKVFEAIFELPERTLADAYTDVVAAAVAKNKDVTFGDFKNFLAGHEATQDIACKGMITGNECGAFAFDVLLVDNKGDVIDKIGFFLGDDDVSILRLLSGAFQVAVSPYPPDPKDNWGDQYDPEKFAALIKVSDTVSGEMVAKNCGLVRRALVASKDWFKGQPCEETYRKTLRFLATI